MFRDIAVVTVAAALIAVGASVNAQPEAPRTVPLDGTVRDARGEPVAEADVVLERHARLASGAQSLQLIAGGRTDRRGAFALGAVAIETEVQFPLETGVNLVYRV